MTTNNMPTVKQIADIVRDHLTETYVCGREAWSYNAMRADVFLEASETNMAEEIAAEVVKLFGQPTMTAEAEWESKLSDQEIIDLAIANNFDDDSRGGINSGWQDGADLTPHILSFARDVIAAEKTK